MPKKGWTSITISDEVYQRLQKCIETVNQKAQFKRFRSVSHLAEEAISVYLNQLEPEFDLSTIPTDHLSRKGNKGNKCNKGEK